MALVRFTRQRRAVLDAVLASREHLDAARVHVQVKKQLPNISLATVYRSLETLVGEGWLVALQQPGAPTRFDRREPRHHHFICDGCGKILDIDVELPDLSALAKASGEQHFVINEVMIEFHGSCANCKRPQA